MRPIHMTVGDRHLVRIDVPGGAHVRFETPAEASGRDCGPAVVGRPVGGPAGEACGAARETEFLGGFPSQQELKRRADEAAAQVMKPFSPVVLCLALAALVLAGAATALSLDRLDRQIELAERV